MLKQQKWLWGVVILLLLISSPGLINRWNVETASDHYEVIIPFEEIRDNAEKSGLSLDETLSTLKESGLTTISFQQVSLGDLEKESIISVFEESELAKSLLFTEFENTVDLEKKGYYISVPESVEHQQLIRNNLNIEDLTIAERPFYFLASNQGIDMKAPIGYDESVIDTVRDYEFSIVLRVGNAPTEEINDKIVQQLISLKSDEIQGLLGSGDEIIGFGQEARDRLINDLHEAGYYFYWIEDNKIKGDDIIGKKTDFEIIRLISLDVNKNSNINLPKSIDMSIRAVKERNIKAIFYHIKEKGNAEDNFETATTYLSSVNEKMSSNYTMGTPKLFDTIVIPSWVTALVLLAGIVFTYIASEIVKLPVLRILATGGMALLAALYFLMDRILFTQAFALIIAVITPIYAVIKSANGSASVGKILVQYLKAVGISAVGIVIVIGLLNGNGFITGYEQFRGVKLVYVIPIVGILIYALLQLSTKDGKSDLTGTVNLLNKEIKYWHLLIFVLIAGIGVFYITRTGNFGAVSSFELTARQWLEDTLYVRPRTKEFLIGFPFFVLALYVMSVSRKWGSLLLVVGVIGFLSMVNTFTHLHIPIGVSVLRSIYSVVLGFVIGIVLIALFKIGYRFSSAKLKRG